MIIVRGANKTLTKKHMKFSKSMRKNIFNEKITVPGTLFIKNQ